MNYSQFLRIVTRNSSKLFLCKNFLSILHIFNYYSNTLHKTTELILILKKTTYFLSDVCNSELKKLLSSLENIKLIFKNGYETITSIFFFWGCF